MIRPFLILVAVSMSVAAQGQSPPTAERLVAQARADAGSQGKHVLLFFSASWCRWCRQFDELLTDKRFAEPFRESYVITKITVRERDELKRNENLGWESLMQALRGSAERDVPYLAVLSTSGEKLGDSYRPPDGAIPGNAGYPRTPSEVSAFLDLVRRTGRAFSAEQRLELRRFLLESQQSPIESFGASRYTR
jgi:thioredoxin-related protein